MGNYPSEMLAERYRYPDGYLSKGGPDMHQVYVCTIFLSHMHVVSIVSHSNVGLVIHGT